MAAIIEAARQYAGLTRREIDIPGFRIAYLDGGKGEPLLALHGIGSDKDAFVMTAAQLTAHYRVIAPDLPGFGESSKPDDAGYAVSAQVERLAAFAQALQLDHFHIAGNSMGGWIAGVYAAAHPQQVQSLWLLAPAGLASAQPSEMFRLIHAGENVPILARDGASLDAMMQFLYSKPPTLSPDFRQELIDKQSESYGRNLRIFAELADGRRNPPLEKVLKDCELPSLIVWGANDRVLDVSGAEVLRQLLPRAEILVMPDVGHVPMLESARQCAADYLRFRKRLAHAP